MITSKILILSALSFGVGALSAITPSKLSNDSIYLLGDTAEAENCVYSGSDLITNNPNASKGKAIDSGESGSFTVSYDLDEAGTYALYVGYYTGTDEAKIGVAVNGGAKVTETLKYAPGWCKDTSLIALDHEVIVELDSGINEIVISSENAGASKYVNFDYVKLESISKADGTRIQAENARKLSGGDGYLRTYGAGATVDGLLASIDDNVSATPTYTVVAPKTGEYVFQVAYYTGNSSSSNYAFTFEANGVSNPITYTFPLCEGGFPDPSHGHYPYTGKFEAKVNLTEGINHFSFNYISEGYIDFDWFRLFDRSVAFKQVLEAEDFVIGDANTQKHEDNYPVLSGYAVELAKGSIELEIAAPASGDYMLFMGGYTATDNAFLNIDINGNKDKLVVDSEHATGWTGDVDEPNLIGFDVALTNGNNKIVITKGEDTLSGNYIDIDYLFFSATRIKVDSIEMDFASQKEVMVDSSILETDLDYELSIENTLVAKVENNKITALRNGSTSLVIEFDVNGLSYFLRIDLNVNVAAYDHPELLKAFDTTKSYNGKMQYVDVEMPSGWSFSQTGAMAKAGVYMVTITFNNPLYESIIRENIKLTITKADYTGTDLYADDVTVNYDGEDHGIVASAPAGWEISYSENEFSSIGDHEVTVTFTHDSYNTVTKKAIVHIIDAKPAEKNNTLGIVLGVIGGVIGAGALAVGAYFFIRKWKSDHETIN